MYQSVQKCTIFQILSEKCGILLIWHDRHPFPHKCAVKLAQKPLTCLKLTLSIFNKCQVSHKSDQPSSQVTTSAAHFCQTRKETRKEEIGRSFIAINYLQSSGNYTLNTCLKLFQVQNVGLDFTICF